MEINEINLMVEKLNNAIDKNIGESFNCTLEQDKKYYILVVTFSGSGMEKKMRPALLIKGDTHKMQSVFDKFDQNGMRKNTRETYYIALFNSDYHVETYSSFPDRHFIDFLFACLSEIGQSQNLSLPECPVVRL